MSLELNHTMQSITFFEGLKTGLYEKASEASEKSSLMRASGPLVAIASAALTLSQRVAGVVEPIIKGLANIFGSPFSKNCSALKGLKQIFIQLPVKVLSLALSPVEIGIGALVTTLGMAISPKGYADYRANDHKGTEKVTSQLSDKNFKPTELGSKIVLFLQG
jgi:hypothetical protein